MIDILNSYGVKATFFLVGEWVDKYPESVKQLSDAGMEIANHSDTHPHMSKLSDKEIMNEVALCNEKIEAITGEPVKLFRCPYGEYDDNVISTINGMDIDVIQWNVERHDRPYNLHMTVQGREMVAVTPILLKSDFVVHGGEQIAFRFELDFLHVFNKGEANLLNSEFL